MTQKYWVVAVYEEDFQPFATSAEAESPQEATEVAKAEATGEIIIAAVLLPGLAQGKPVIRVVA